jgi:hypothetical protein
MSPIYDGLKNYRYFNKETSLAEDVFINTKALRGNGFKSIYKWDDGE